MSKLVQASKIKTARTENGAVAHQSTLSAIVDLYQLAGSSRNHVGNIVDPFLFALREDKDLAVRIMLHARDVRQGMGERAVGRKMMQTAIRTLSYEDNMRIMRKIPEMGRWDDLEVYFGTKYQDAAFHLTLAGLDNPETAGLVAKWLPREKKSTKKFVHEFCKFSGLSRIEYRKLCAQLSNTVEQKLCAKDYAAIDFNKVPSVAAARYQKVFHKVDGERYRAWIAELTKPVAERAAGVKVNAGAVYPYNVLTSSRRGDASVAQAQWEALPDYMQGSDENILCISDVSGSMTSERFGDVNALDIGLSLTMYCAERNHGVFKNVAMVYSTNPFFVELTGSLKDRERQLMKHVEYGSTDLQKAFDKILGLAQKHNLAQEDLPSKVIIFSDMEFDSVCRGGGDTFGYGSNETNFEAIRRKFEQAGYVMPQIVFWHLASRKPKAQATVNDKGVAIVSGFSPAILKAVLGGEDMSPLAVVKKAVMVERYDW